MWHALRGLHVMKGWQRIAGLDQICRGLVVFHAPGFKEDITDGVGFLDLSRPSGCRADQPWPCHSGLLGKAPNFVTSRRMHYRTNSSWERQDQASRPISLTAIQWLAGDCAAIRRQAQTLNAALSREPGINVRTVGRVRILKRHTPIEEFAGPHAIRIHQQNPDIRTKTIHHKPDPRDAGTKQLVLYAQVVHNRRPHVHIAPMTRVRDYFTDIRKVCAPQQ